MNHTMEMTLNRFGRIDTLSNLIICGPSGHAYCCWVQKREFAFKIYIGLNFSSELGVPSEAKWSNLSNLKFALDDIDR